MDHPLYQASLEFARRLPPLPDRGALKVLPGAHGQDDAVLLREVATGSLDLAWVSSASYASLVPRAAALDVPGAFADARQVDVALESTAARELLEAAADKGVRGLAWGGCGFLALSTRERPLRRPADLQLLQVRVIEGQTHPAWFRALGATPVDRPFNDLFPALLSASLPAQESPPATLYSARLYRAQKYITLTRHAFSAAALVVNQARFAKLPSEYRERMLQTANEVAAAERSSLPEIEATMVQRMRADGYDVIDVGAAEREALLAQGRGAVAQAGAPFAYTLEELRKV